MRRRDHLRSDGSSSYDTPRLPRPGVLGVVTGVAQPARALASPDAAQREAETRGRIPGALDRLAGQDQRCDQNNQLDDVDRADVEQVARTWTPVDNPKSCPGEEKTHRVSSHDLTIVRNEEPGREVESPDKLGHTKHHGCQGQWAHQHPHHLGCRAKCPKQPGAANRT